MFFHRPTVQLGRFGHRFVGPRAGIKNSTITGPFTADNGNGPALAVEATPTDERPEIVLFATLAVTREEVNAKIKEAGLSPLHNIRIMGDRGNWERTRLTTNRCRR